MDTLDAVFTRRSIRKYTDKAVPEEQVTDLLKAAMAAPSAGNEQAWQFIVIRDRAILDAIPKFHPYSAMLKYASVAVLICGDLTLEKFKGFWVQDCSAATSSRIPWVPFFPLEIGQVES